ncbi:hypothetical protein [Lacticaseibacillus brantae]|uniref:Uncharacterized protein n=1 Tax=Lacticaseibacillus brantae DSM 23927 TaxID=1423727 RepID=A0A0R2BAU0_9LACO|nr:hypothetical protein [Lacticaseibacillus brantae]KRM72739.1 hypothetical protein FC34_GL000449 [Lacticaseibacillus brantae DSM 23927]
MDINAEDVKTATQLVLDQGYVTKKDVPAMADRDYAMALGDQVGIALRKTGDHDYIYAEEFDYADQTIATIIWDMDKFPTRHDAMEQLGQALNLPIPTVTVTVADEVEY